MGTIYKKVGENIRKVRKSKGMTQEQLAEVSRLDPKSIIAMESGNRNPTLKTLHRIALALKVTPNDLLN